MIGIACGAMAAQRIGRLSPGAASLIARMLASPSAPRATLIGNTYDGLAASSFWSKLDGIGFAAAQDAQAGGLDWKDAAHDLVVTGTPGFVVDRGFTGAVNSNLSTGFAPSTAGGQWALNSASQGFFGTLAGLAGSTSNCMGVGAFAGTTSTAYIVPRNGSSMLNARCNDAVGISFANTSTLGLFSIRRSASNARQIDINGAQVATNSQVSTSIQAGNLHLLYGDATNVSNLRCGAWFYGSYLTNAEMLHLYGIMNSYLAAVGAI